MKERLVTDRLVLRKPEYDDIDELYRIHSDPETNKYNPSGPHKNIEETKEMIHSWIQHWDEYGFGYWIIVNKESNEIMGICGLRKSKLKNSEVFNLAYRIESASWKKGFIKEAAKASIQYILQDIDPDALIMARTKYNNIPSINTAKSLGFVMESKLDDYEEKGDVYLFNKDFFTKKKI